MINIGSVTSVVFILLKIMSLLGIGMYVIFAAIMVRQEQLMSKSLEASFEPILRILVIIHLLAALAVFGLAVVFL